MLSRLHKALYRAIFRYAREVDKSSSGLLYLTSIPMPEFEYQRFQLFSIKKESKEKAKTLVCTWKPRVALQSVLEAVNVDINSLRCVDSKLLKSWTRSSFRNKAVCSEDAGFEAIKELSLQLMLAKAFKTTNASGVRITAAPVYSEENSTDGGHVYFYRISIENHSEKPIKLLGRHWIFESEGVPPQIVPKFALGVIGETPILQPGQGFTYMSSTKISSICGVMRGAFLFSEVTEEGETENGNFEVPVGPAKLTPLRN